MPRKYVRKHNTARGLWTEDNLKLAIEKVKKGEISKNEAQRRYGIPIRTLSRRLQTGNTIKSGLGPQASLGLENEKLLASYIQRLASAGFAPNRNTIRCLAYQFAEKFGIPHKFAKAKEKAGQHWLTSFLERNKDISVQQAEGLSVARAQGMNRGEVNAFFKMLEEDMVKNDLSNKPQNISNVAESGFQLPNKPGKVLTTKDAKDVHVIPPREKGKALLASTVKRKQVTCVLTSPQNLDKTDKLNLIKRQARKCKIACSGLAEASSTSQKDESDPIKDDNNKCVECWENYFLTKKKTKWIKCDVCLKWLHETCTMYVPHCNNCGRDMVRNLNQTR